MMDRRTQILDAALAVLREDGYVGFTQPRVAAKAGVRQSHLTYYFPTRSDLLTAVATMAVEVQLGTADLLLDGSSPQAAAASVAKVISQPDNARVLLTLVCASDDVPEVRDRFRTLAAGMVDHGQTLLDTLGSTATPGAADLLYAASVGLAAINFATARPQGEEWAASVIQSLLDLIPQQEATKTKGPAS